jgi:predicted metal-dependent hydrolase
MQQTLTLPNGHTIAYWLALRPRKTIGLKITQDGLVVHAPKRVQLAQLNQILLQKSPWILNKLAQREQYRVPPFEWVDGADLLLLGQAVKLQLRTHSSNKLPTLDGDALILASTQPDRSEWVSRKVIQWYQKQAIQDFSRRLAIFATKLGVAVPPLALSNARSRWGSCNSRGEVRLNWRLVQAPPPLINYVICHELAHLKEMNHSPRFYAVLAQLLPNHKLLEIELKQWSPQLHRMT